MAARFLTAPSLRLPPLSRLLYKGAVLAWHWELRRSSRVALRNLPEHLLADIGLTRDEADAEVAKTFCRD